MKVILISLAFVIAGHAQAQNSVKDSFLFKVENHKTGAFCFVNKDNDTIVPFGKYEFCETDTLKYYAIVSTFKSGLWYAINRQGRVMYQIFPYDTGPDHPSDSLFRIIIDNKIGFAHQKTGEIVIRAQYKCASSFKNGIAIISFHCKYLKSGRHVHQNKKHWNCIDTKGNRIEKPSEIVFDEYY